MSSDTAPIDELQDPRRALSIAESPTWSIVDELGLADETIALLADQRCWALGHALGEQQHVDLTTRLAQPPRRHEIIGAGSNERRVAVDGHPVKQRLWGRGGRLGQRHP